MLQQVSYQAVKGSPNVAEFQPFLVFACRSLYVYSLRFFERKDHVVWQGFNHETAVFGRCGECVLNWTVLLLKILN